MKLPFNKCMHHMLFSSSLSCNPAVSCLSAPPMPPADSPEARAQQRETFHCALKASLNMLHPNKCCPLPAGHL